MSRNSKRRPTAKPYVSHARIVDAVRSADAVTVALGTAWYPAAESIARELATEFGVTLECAAAVIAHTSPRTAWDLKRSSRRPNIEAARVVLGNEARPAWVLRRNYDNAMRAMVADNPLDTFGPRAPKTRSFARNIVGDVDAVTVDVWAARVVGVSEKRLARVGGYQSVARAYRRAAAELGITPRECQAIAWMAIRGA